MSKLFKPTLALDFDGVLHRYSEGWQDGEIYDPPVEGTKKALEYLAEKYKVVVFTARAAGNPALIWQWLYEHKLHKFIDAVTNTKPIAKLYVDDRAYRFEGIWTTKKLEEIDKLVDH